METFAHLFTGAFRAALGALRQDAVVAGQDLSATSPVVAAEVRSGAGRKTWGYSGIYCGWLQNHVINGDMFRMS